MTRPTRSSAVVAAAVAAANKEKENQQTGQEIPAAETSQVQDQNLAVNQRPGKEHVRDRTPEGHIDHVPLDKFGNPTRRDGEGGRDSSKEDNRANSQQEFDDAVKAYLTRNQQDFIKFVEQQKAHSRGGEHEAVSESRHWQKSPSVRILDTRDTRIPPRLFADDRQGNYNRVSPRRDAISPRRHADSPRRSEDNYQGGRFGVYGRISTPFTNRILYTPLPSSYKVPPIKPYNGSCDPQNFLSQYQYNMVNQGLSDDIYMCKVFPELLIDNARMWFDSLPPRSIGSYDELMEVFEQRFF